MNFLGLILENAAEITSPYSNQSFIFPATCETSHFLGNLHDVRILELATAGKLSTASILWGIPSIHTVVRLYYAGKPENLTCLAILQHDCFLQHCITPKILNTTVSLIKLKKTI